MTLLRRAGQRLRTKPLRGLHVSVTWHKVPGLARVSWPLDHSWASQNKWGRNWSRPRNPGYIADWLQCSLRSILPYKWHWLQRHAQPHAQLSRHITVHTYYDDEQVKLCQLRLVPDSVLLGWAWLSLIIPGSRCEWIGENLCQGTKALLIIFVCVSTQSRHTADKRKY